MTKESLKKVATIAMPIAIFDFINVEKPGRMKNLYTKLLKQCEKRLAELPTLAKSDHLKIKEKIYAFGKAAGWEKQEKRIETYIAFCLCLLDEQEKVTGIIEALNDICSFMENIGKSPQACMWSGALAFEKWETVWSDNGKTD